ncbi:MAG: ABC transporter permease [Bacteroidia bacterium]|nr:ABC transporter permease [Bacteroidia bacterium]
MGALIWRYLFRSPRPIIRWLLRLSFIGLSLSAWAWIVVASVFNGFSDFLEEVFQRADPQVRLIGRGLSDSLRSAIEKYPEVLAASGIYERIALLRYGGRQAAVRLRLVDEKYPQVSHIGSQLLWGETFPLRPKAILMGAGIAAQLAVADAEEMPLWIYVIPSGKKIAFVGLEGLQKQKGVIQGIFSVQKEYDESWVIARQADWTNLRLSDYEVIELRLRPGYSIERFIKHLKSALPSQIHIQDPRQQHEGLYKVLSQEKVLARIGLFFLLILTLTGVISTLSAFLLLGRRDWALYQALGASQSWVERFLRHLNLALLATAISSGLLLGTATVILQDQYHLVKLRGGEGFLIEHFPVKLAVDDYLWMIGLVAGAFMLLSAYTKYQLRQIDLRSSLQGD